MGNTDSRSHSFRCFICVGFQNGIRAELHQGIDLSVVLITLPARLLVKWSTTIPSSSARTFYFLQPQSILKSSSSYIQVLSLHIPEPCTRYSLWRWRRKALLHVQCKAVQISFRGLEQTTWYEMYSKARKFREGLRCLARCLCMKGFGIWHAQNIVAVIGEQLDPHLSLGVTESQICDFMPEKPC